MAGTSLCILSRTACGGAGLSVSVWMGVGQDKRVQTTPTRQHTKQLWRWAGHR